MRRAALLAAVALLASPGRAAEPRDWHGEGRAAVAAARALPRHEGPARNVVIFLGDGMGLTTVTAARIFEGQQRGEPGEENLLPFERLPHVMLTKTYNTDQQTPDSAGTITAILTGAKTRAGVIGLAETVPRGDAAAAKRGRLQTLFEQAEDRGLATGIVTTARVTHATPAAAYAHSPERGWEDDASLPEEARALDYPDIARQLIEFPHGDGIEVVLGGGRARFLPVNRTDPEYPERRGARRDGRDLMAEWSARGPRWHSVWSRKDLDALEDDEVGHLLGLFEPSHMRFESDRAEDPGGEPSLAELTRLALRLLARGPKGFVLLVEGGRIDHAHHMGNAYRALVDTVALGEAVTAALELTDPKETLVVVTADHGHVLTLAGYPTRGNPILGKVRENDPRGGPSPELARDALGLPYTTLGYQNGPGYTGARHESPEGPKNLARDVRVIRQQGIHAGRPDLDEVDTQAPGYLQEATVPLDAETHSAEDVPVYAGGAGAWLFQGVQEQSYLYHAMVEALGWNAAPSAKGRPGE